MERTSDDFMTRADCADIRHRFDKEQNALIAAKQRETESKLRQEIESACTGLEEKNADLREWIIASTALNQQWWEKMDERIWGLYVWFAILCLAILIAMYFKIDVSGFIP